MPKISRDEYTTEEQERYDAAFSKLKGMVFSTAQNHPKFRRILDKALSEGFPVDYAGPAGYTLLEWTLDNDFTAVRADLLQMLIEAGADVNVKNSSGRHTPLGLACWRYVWGGEPECLQAVETLLAAGARPELDESWKEGWSEPKELKRKTRVEARIAVWMERRATLNRSKSAASAFDYAL